MSNIISYSKILTYIYSKKFWNVSKKFKRIFYLRKIVYFTSQFSKIADWEQSKISRRKPSNFLIKNFSYFSHVKPLHWTTMKTKIHCVIIINYNTFHNIIIIIHYTIKKIFKLERIIFSRLSRFNLLSRLQKFNLETQQTSKFKRETLLENLAKPNFSPVVS